MFNAMTDGHYVVPIGGAQFVPPHMSFFLQAPAATSPSSEASSSAGPSSPVHSRFSSSSSTSTDNGEYSADAARAHLHYAKVMADHTAAMWQKERLSIEKSKLNGTYVGDQTSRQNGNAKPPADPKPSAATSKCSASSSSSTSSSTHRRFVSAFASIPLFSAFHHHSESPRGRSRIPKNRS